MANRFHPDEETELHLWDGGCCMTCGWANGHCDDDKNQLALRKAKYAAESKFFTKSHDPEPQPGDGPEYHADHVYWEARQPEKTLPPCDGCDRDWNQEHYFDCRYAPPTEPKYTCCHHCDYHPNGLLNEHSVPCHSCANDAMDLRDKKENDRMNLRIGDVPPVIVGSPTAYTTGTDDLIFTGTPPAGKSDPVNHPAHYNNGPKCECGKVIECIDVTRHHSLLRGTAIKYLWRADYKDAKRQDLLKAIWYIQKELDTMDD